ncbi:MAG: septum formation family protein [Acidimicrobiia bacterium]
MRRLKVVLAVLAVLAAACSRGTEPSVIITRPPATTAPDTTSPPTTGPRGSDEYLWRVGDCFTFEGPFEELPYAPYGTESQAGCDATHTHEVYFTGVFPGGEVAAYPAATIDEEIRTICAEAFVEYVGVLLVESGLDIVMYLPDEMEWASGERYQACVLYLPASEDDYQAVTESQRAAGDSIPLHVEAGQCFPGVYSKLPTLSCNLPHRAEAIGTVSHPAPSGDPFPGLEQLRDFANEACTELIDPYVVGEPRPVGRLLAVGDSFTSVEWEAGWRQFVCLAFVLGPDGGVLPVAGSFAEPGWLVLEGDFIA